MKRPLFNILISLYIIIGGIVIGYYIWVLHCVINIDYLKAYQIYCDIYSFTIIYVIGFILMCSPFFINDEEEIVNIR